MIVRCAYDKLVPISELKLNKNNRNIHPKEQIERLGGILAFQGWRYPVKVSKRSGMVVSGHGRVEAALFNKWDTVPVNFQDYDDAESEYADSIADNAIASWSELDLLSIQMDVSGLSTNFKVDFLGMKDFSIVDPEKLEPGCDEDEVPEHVESKTKLGDIYKLGNHRLMCGDSTSIDAVEKLMAGEKADMVFTDPPYGIDIVQGSSVGGSKPFGSVGGGKLCKVGKYSPIIGDSTTQTAIDSYNLCAGLGIETLIFWGGNYYASALPDSSCWIVWDKENTGNFADAELAWTNKKTAVRIFKHMWNGMIKASEHGSKRVHPTQKPIVLAEWCFENSGNPNTVLDLFGGSGSTLIACEKTKRKCFMMELDPKYCSVIVERWCKYTNKEAYLLNGNGTQTAWSEIKAMGQ
jgi:DNA modification methylase